MPQPIDISPPWWDGTVAIPFSIEEWKSILRELQMLYNIPAFPHGDHDHMIVNIMDRIEKGIGTE